MKKAAPHEVGKKHRFADFALTEKSTVFVAGSGRSGTTWLADLINYRGGFRCIFEPFWAKKTDVCSMFDKRQYLRGTEIYPEHAAAASAIIKGKSRSDWTDRGNRRRVYFKRLIKEIRANLFLFWLHNRFPAMPIVFLMRHPCAVVRSKLKMGWRWDVKELLNQKDLVDDFLDPFKDILQSAAGDFEHLLLLWCVENYVPLQQFGPGNLFVVFYENLAAEPEREIDRIFAWLGRKAGAEVIDLVSKPSALSREHSAIRSGRNVLDVWKEDIDDVLLKKALDVLAAFGLDSVYSADIMPAPGGLTGFYKSR